jgi:hypothetical protein
MNLQRGLARRAHRKEPLMPSSIILAAEAMAVTLLIFVLVLGLTRPAHEATDPMIGRTAVASVSP